MNIRLRFLFYVLMIIAFISGFVQIYFPPEQYNFERLHIFLFNLCTGCTILLYYTESSSKISDKLSYTGMLFLAGSLVYALTAFLEFYQLTIAVSVLLVMLVEKVRIKRFSFFPFAFFNTKVPVSEKFHQAALLCLSIGIFMACLVIINNEYLNFINIEKLTLNTFFLGFSFPLSLITFSMVFSMVNSRKQNNEDIYAVSRSIRGMMEICFWAITLGVISFFIFILSEKIVLQAIIAIVLLFAVIKVFLLYIKFVKASQQKSFLLSGIGFLIFTALTGIAYIFYEMSGNYEPAGVKWLLHMHIFASLYGWNICGLTVISRFQTFPVKIHLPSIIGLHWLVAIVLAPLGIFYGEFAILAVIAYGFIMAILFLR